ncbi:MAG: hypothetical protein AAF394_09030, partial [Planctomycetota bacterium]
IREQLLSSDQEQAPDESPQAAKEEADRKTDRNAKRFRLRSLLRVRLSYLLILITIIAVVLGTVVREARNEARVLELWADESDLLFASSYRLSDPPENAESYPKWYREAFSGMLLQDIESIALNNMEFEYLDDEQVAEIFRRLPLAENLQEFKWLAGVPTNELIVGLSRLPELRVLTLTDAKLEPESFSGVSCAESLDQLKLSRSNFEGKDIFSRRKFPALEVLDLDRTRITDSVVQQLCELPLRKLDISGNRLTPEAFVSLSNLDELEMLRMVGLEIDLQTCEQIAQLSNLRKLDLSRSTISDAGVRILCEGLPALEALTLDYCQQLSDAAMEPIAKRKNLEVLSILGSNVSPSGGEHLASAKLERLELSPAAISVEVLHSFHADALQTNAWGDDPFSGTYLESDDPALSRDVVRELLKQRSTSRISLHQVPIETSDLTALENPESISLVGTEVDDAFFSWLNEDQDSLFSLELRDNAITAKGIEGWDIPSQLVELSAMGLTLPGGLLRELANVKTLAVATFEAEPDFSILLQFLGNTEINKIGGLPQDPFGPSYGSLNWYLPDVSSNGEEILFFGLNESASMFSRSLEVYGPEITRQQLRKVLSQCDIAEVTIRNPTADQLEMFTGPSFGDLDLELRDLQADLFDAEIAERLAVHSLVMVAPECPIDLPAAFVEKLPEGIALDLECSPRDLKAELPSVISLLNRKTAKVVVNLNDLADLSLLVNSDAQDWGDDCRIAGKKIELKRLRDWMSGDPFAKDTMSLVLTPNLGTKEQLAGLRDLKHLDQVCWIGDSAAVPDEIFACQHLDYLTFSNCQVSGALVRKIALLQSVLGLVFYNCELDSAAYRELSELHLLESISFENCKLQPDELRNFTPPRGLEYVYFDTCEIDPGCIPIIETWTSLSQCVPVDCNLSRAQLRRVYRR